MFSRAFFLASFVAIQIVEISFASAPTYSYAPSAPLAIHRNEIHAEVRLIAENYIKTLSPSKNFDIYDIPLNLKAEYEQHLANAENTLITRISNKAYLFIDYSDVEDVTKSEVAKFINKMNSVVLKSNLDEKINDAICDLIHQNGMIKDDIKKHAATEYDTKYNKVRAQFLYKTYVTQSEIETAVYNEFIALIKRIKAQVKNSGTQNQSTSSSWQDFWDWLRNGNSSTNSSNNSKDKTSKLIYTYYNDYDVIYSNNLDNKVLEITNRILKDKNYDPENIPARVVSDYSDVVQKIVQKTREKMGYASSIYVYEIRNIAQNEIKIVIDKINYKGERCNICLDDIRSWQTLGVLSCGHFFHKDCINKALSYDYRCPLCGTHTSKIDHTETVPLS